MHRVLAPTLAFLLRAGACTAAPTSSPSACSCPPSGAVVPPAPSRTCACPICENSSSANSGTSGISSCSNGSSDSSTSTAAAGLVAGLVVLGAIALAAAAASVLLYQRLQAVKAALAHYPGPEYGVMAAPGVMPQAQHQQMRF